MHYNVGSTALEFLKVSNFIREKTKQIFLLYCLESVLEWLLISMVWSVMPVDMFRTGQKFMSPTVLKIK
jgi:hypothetical protein